MPIEVPLPAAEPFGLIVAGAQPKHRAIVRLHALFVDMGRCEMLEEQVKCLLLLMRWLRSGRSIPTSPDAEAKDSPMTTRLRLLLLSLEQVEGAREAFASALNGVITQARAIDLFARLGLPEDRSFLSEMIDRLWRWVLPEGLDDRDPIQLLGRLFPSRVALSELGAIPPELFNRLLCVLARTKSQPGALLTSSMQDALRLLALRIAASGLFDALRRRSPQTPLDESPFFQLPQVANEYIAQMDAHAPEESLAEVRERAKKLVESCQVVVTAVVENLERSGVSVDVVYRLEAIGKGLRRYLDLVAVLAEGNQPATGRERARLLVTLVDARLREGELREIVRSNLHLLARKIIERAGETGDHYITSSRKEYFHLLSSAAGGGVLTVGTTVLKYLIMWVHFAPLVEGILSAANYAGSFLVMQLLGFTLATKQPSMTAAAVAASMRKQAGQNDLSGLVTMIARVTRSQLAAATGNLGLVIPAAAVFDFYWRTQHGTSFLDADTAAYILHSLSLFGSGTVFYAALTGALLWTASIGAGWFENFSVYRQIPQAIETHRLRKFLGRGVTGWASRAFHRNVSGVGGNVTLGVLLGMTPVVGKFVGLPLDVRHVTLSTGALTLAVCAQGKESLFSHEFRDAMLGVVVIGILNFGVSFILALLVALRAKDVGIRDRFRLLMSVGATLVRSPLQFLFPPASATEGSVHGPVSRRGNV